MVSLRPIVATREVGQRATSRVPQPRDEGIVGAGEAVIRAGEQQDRLQQAQEATDADLKFAQFQSDNLRRYREAQDNAQRGAPNFERDFLADYDQRAQEAMGNVAPRQRGAFQARLVGLRNQSAADAIQWQDNKRVEQVTSNLDDALQLRRNMVASEPGEFWMSREMMRESIQASELRPEVKDDLLNKSDQALFQSFSSAAIQSDPQAFKEALNGGEFDNVAQGNQKAVALKAAQGEIDRRRREAETRQREMETLRRAETVSWYSAELSSLASGAGTTGLTPEVVERDIGGERGRRMATQLGMKQQTAQVMDEIATVPAAELPSVLQGIVRPEGQDFDLEMEERKAISDAVLEKQRLLTEDAAQYVHDRFPEVRDVFTNAAGDTAAMESAIELSQQTQREQLGSNVGVRALPKTIVNGMVRDVVNRDPNEQGAALEQILQGSGRFAPQVLAEMKQANLPAGIALAGEMFGDGRFQMSRAMAEASSRSRAEQKKLAGEDAADIEAQIGTDTEDFRTAWVSTTLGDEYATRKEAAILLAWQLRASGESVGDASAKAIAETFPYELMGGERFRNLAVPNGINQDDVEFTLNEAVSRLTPDDIDFAATGIVNNLDPRLTPDMIGRAVADSIRGNHSWRNSQDGAQLLDETMSPVPLKDGGFFIVPWEALQTAPPPTMEEEASP